MAPDTEWTDEALSGPEIDRRTAISLLGAAGLGGLAGCTGGDGTETPTEGGTDDGTASPTATPPSEDQFGGRLQAGWYTGAIEQMDPPYISVGQYFQLASNVFNGLTTLKPDLTVRGDLAEDWTVEDDGATFTFQLRDDVTFHNGEQFTAEDVRYTINRTIQEEAPAASKLSSLQPVDDGGVEVVGDYEVTLRFEEPNAVALIYLTRGPGRAATIVNQTAIEEMGADQYGVTPVGTGPFQVTEHEVGSGVTLDAYDDYFETDENGNQLPYLDGIDVQPIPEPASIVNALRAGDIDFANMLPLQNLQQIEDAQNARVDSKPGINWTGFAMNQEREPFGDRQVRRGIAKVIDNQAFVDSAFFGNALADTGVLNKGTAWVWREEGEKPSDQQYAPEEGKQLLEDAGADGASFSILANSGNLRAAEAMRNQLNNAGLDVSIDQVTSSTYWTRYEEGEYDTTISGSVIDPDPDQSLWNFYRLPDEGGVWNWVNHVDEEVHQLLAEQRGTVDRDARREVLWELEDKLIQDVPHAYLHHQDDIAGVSTSVQGFQHIPGLRYFHTVYLDE
ncbi:ABC transporter substrate-binding protein [Halolamina salina]|uniref:ABC transporter substrate-binding protein n=1 Tax=Halolamina salina TaxID=1220023 RepID=A0ABD6B7K6_9EURY